MIRFDFDAVHYKKPHFHKTTRGIDSVIGFDTEAYRDGKTFMFCTSAGDVFKPADIPEQLFSRSYRNEQFGVWNLKYDSGAILHDLSPSARTRLRTQGKVNHNGFNYSYIPHKMLRIARKKNAVTFWDINNFYHSKLETAAEKYLGSHKKELDPKLFTRAYVKKNWSVISDYCLQDSHLVAELYQYFLKGLESIDLVPSNLYSTASVAFHYFKHNCKIIDVYRYWKYYKNVLRFACESYNGGKFEMYRRGRFEGVSYDINSAYPYEMANLLDISKAVVIRSDKYVSEASYGFVRCFIDNTECRHLSNSLKIGQLNIYPAGTFNTTITMQEYDYLKSIKVPVKILDGYWLLIQDKQRPYYKVVTHLYKMKNYYKTRDPRLYMIYKIMLNSFYGKMAQLIGQPDGSIKAGQAWNPIYASVITANVRIRLAQLTHEFGKDIYAVHTDSVITGRDVPKSYLGKRLGLWQKEDEGDGVIIACGIYSIGDKNKFRGIDVTKKTRWIPLLKKNGRTDKIKLRKQLVTSWVEANFRHKDECTNLFEMKSRTLDLNCDSKRIWLERTDAEKLLNGYQYSIPHVIVDSVKKDWILPPDNT